MDVNALTQMLANGWPLALAGFVFGVIAGGLAARKAVSDRRGDQRAAPDDAALSALGAELKAAKDLLEAEEAEAGEVDEALKQLDEAVKRANGRLKLISKAQNLSN